MKKHFLIILVLMAFTMAVTAQTKRIAILETVDKKGDVPYGVLLQLRSNLTYAISNTPGYEGYDRVDMAQIMGEHDFQRTGMVSDEQIRRLGEMTGCSSILVAEAAVYDKENIIITAKILNVETASVERAVPPQISNINPEKMQKACMELADKLLVKVYVVIEEPEMNPEVEFAIITKGKDFYGKDYYSLGEQKLTAEQYMGLLKKCPEAWYTYEKGTKQIKTGKTVMYSGIGVVAVGAGIALWGVYLDGKEHAAHSSMYDINRSYEYCYYAGGVLAGLGIITTVIAIPIKSAGNSKQSNAYKVYNQYCSQPKATLSFVSSVNGISICLNF